MESPRIAKIWEDSTHGVLYEYDFSTRIGRVEGDSERLLGYTGGELSNRIKGVHDWVAMMHPMDAVNFSKVLEKEPPGERSYEFEYRIRHASGRYIWLLDRGQTLKTDRTMLAVGVLQDISKWRTMEQRLYDLADVVGAYLWEIDASGRYTHVSKRVKDVLGYEPGDLLGKSYLDYILPEDREAVSSCQKRTEDGRWITRECLQRKRCSNGKVIWCMVNGVLMQDADGNFLGEWGSTIDVTAQQEALNTVLKERDEVIATDRAKNDFLAVMSHELRTPLNSVLGFSDLLSLTPLSEEQRDYVEMIRTGGTSLLSLLDNILDYVRIRSARDPVHLRTFDIRVLCDEVFARHRQVAAAKNIVMELDIDMRIPGKIVSDPDLLRQILANLVDNAVKFTIEGRVSLRVERDDDNKDESGDISLRISVRDTGIGVVEEKRSLLFEPFTQGDTSYSRRFGGAGMGLAICKEMVDALGGRISLESTSPGGSNFEVVLCVEEAPPEPFIPPRKRGPLRSSARVLVAEDNVINRQVMLRMLESFGIQADSVTNGEECVDIYKQDPYDVIFMDVRMPGLDGVAATKKIREYEAQSGEGHHAYIVALTAEALPEDRLRCLNAGMDYFVPKPITREILLAAIQRD